MWILKKQRSVVWSLTLCVAAQLLNNSGGVLLRPTLPLLSCNHCNTWQKIVVEGAWGGVTPKQINFILYLPVPFPLRHVVFEFACFETCRSVGSPPPGLTGYQRVPLIHFQYSQSVAQRPTFTRIYSEFNVTDGACMQMNELGHDLLIWLNLLALSPSRLPVQFIFLFKPEKPSRKFLRLRNKSHKASQRLTLARIISAQRKCTPKLSIRNVSFNISLLSQVFTDKSRLVWIITKVNQEDPHRLGTTQDGSGGFNMIRYFSSERP